MSKWFIRNNKDNIEEYSFILLKSILKRLKNIDSEEIAKSVESVLYYNYFKSGAIPHITDIEVLIDEFYQLKTKVVVPTSDTIKSEDLSTPIENKSVTQIQVKNLIEDYLNLKDWRIQENSNMNYSLQGLNFHLSSSMIAKYWLNEVYPDEIGTAHISGEFHIHDLGILGPYCVGWDLQELLLKGFGGVSNKIESAPAKHFGSILGQVVNFFYTLQGEAAGAQAFSNFDTLLAPFVYFDKLSYKDVKQKIQEFIFNLNVPTRVGFQAPFTNITLDLTPSPALEQMPVVIGGETLDDYVYGDFQNEMNLINRALAEVLSEGDAKGRIFTFPIPTYNIHKNFDFDNPEYESIWEMTGKYGIPYFSNFVNSELDPDDVRSMCCRLRLDTKELKSRGGGLFGANPQTGSIGVVTINMPRLAYLSGGDMYKFYELLDKSLEKAKQSLEIKRNFVEQLTDAGLFPYTNVYLSSVKQRFGTWWANHFSTIGIIGMNEATLNFMKKPITDFSAKEWVIEVMEYLREKLHNFQEETGNYYNLEASPAEGASFRLAKADLKNFKDIAVQGSYETPYYTNSVHPPANKDLDVFDLLEHQDELQTMFTGGTVVHLYLGEAITEPTSVKELVRSVVYRFKLPYFSVTPTFSICPVHGYIPSKQEYCPYSHTDEDLKKYGKTLEIDVDSLKTMDSSSYRELI